MAWNEPGGNNDKDPWGNRNNQDGPPDLDELVKKIQDKFGGILGGKGSGGRGSDSSGGGSSFMFSLIGIVIVVLWAASGIYIVDEAERGVVLRFGEYNKTTGPGPHWHIPYPVDNVLKVNVDELRGTTHKSQMLTKDENLIQIDLAVQYKVKDAQNYLFSVREPDKTITEASESALREVVGSKKLDDILTLTGGREILVRETEEKTQAILDGYNTGLLVAKVNLESAQPPQEVQSAFEDAIKAREDQDRYKKQAEAYERDIIPKAEGDAQRLMEEAEAYKQRNIEKARGETSRFLQTLAEYAKAPQITRKRLYLETMEQVLSVTNKVLIKVEQGNQILYLPLDRMINPVPKVTDSSQLDSSNIDDFMPTETQTQNRSFSRNRIEDARIREGR